MAKTIRRRVGPIFKLQPGRFIDRRYLLGEFIGSGYEGEVYHLTEQDTGIERVAKFFYPKRLPNRRKFVRLAQKMNRLRNCGVVLQYHHHGEIQWRREKVPYMVSELAPGTVLYDLLRAQPRKRFSPFEALHLTYAIARGVAAIHALREYHGDIHEDNILVERRGIGFRVKIIDLYLHPRDMPDLRKADTADIANLLYMMVGGPTGYSRCPQLIKSIVCGRRLQTLYKKFPNAGALCDFMTQYPWPEPFR